MSAISVVAFDYGGVIAQRIDENTVLHMAAEAGAAPGPFLRALWSHRLAYDAGTLEAPAYWSAVLRDAGGRELTDELLQTLLILDALGWTRVNPGMVRWMGALRRAGLRLVLISNMAIATYEMVVEPSSWIHLFDHVVLSGREGINKPDPRIFGAAVERMGARPAELLFIDDIPANVEGARSVGLHSCVFVDPPSLALTLHRDFPGVPAGGLLAT